MVSLRVRAEFGDRLEAHIAAAPGGWLTVSARALTRWTDAGPDEPLVVPDALPGPLRWLPHTGCIGWGPAVLDGLALKWTPSQLSRDLLSDVSDLARRRFSIAVGAVSGDESEIFVAYRHPRSRVRGGSDPAEPLRQAIVHPDGTVVEIVPPVLPTVVLWEHGELALGTPGVIRVRRRGRDWHDRALSDESAPRALARGSDGQLYAGTARGEIVVFDDEGERRQNWSAHEGPVTALSASTGVLASGGIDGIIRIWEGDRPKGEAQLGRPIVDLAWAGTSQLVAVVGNSGEAVVSLTL